MSTKSTTEKLKCEILELNSLEWIYHNVILLYLTFVFSRFIHELGHSIANSLTGGVFSLETLQIGWFFVVPMGTMQYDTGSLLVVYAGPLLAITVGLIYACTHSFAALGGGKCGYQGKLNKWKTKRGIIFGFLLQALWDAIYLNPSVDPTPFNGFADGDGVEAAKTFKEMGLHQITVFDTSVVINPAHLISAVAVLVTLYITWQVVKCAPEMCNVCKR